MSIKVGLAEKQLLIMALENRHKFTCIQVTHSKAHECNCGLKDLTKLVLELADQNKKEK